MTGVPIPLVSQYRAGVYRHYKGPLYEARELAHDANSDTLFDAQEEPQFPDGRIVVVYQALQLDGAHEGPRTAVRTLEDFLAIVCTNPTHPHLGDVLEMPLKDMDCWPRRRFHFLGPVFLARMLRG